MSSQIQTPAGPIRPGDVIRYADRTCRVDAVMDNVKNDRPGFDATVIHPGTPENPAGQPVWGYAAQVTHVARRP